MKVADGTNAENGQLAPETDIPTDGTANTDPFVAIITMTAGSQTAVHPYQLRHIYNTVDPDNNLGGGTVVNGPETARFESTLYYRVRTITNNDVGDSEMKSTSYTSTSVSIGLLRDADNNVNPPIPAGFVAPIVAPLVGADAAFDAANPANNQDEDGSGTADPDATPAALRLHTSHETDGASSYRVDVSTDDGKTWVTHEAASRPINEYDFRGPSVKPGKGYWFRLFSKKGRLGLASAVVKDFAGYSKAPGGVRNLTATADGAGMINLSWNPPTSDGGAMIDTYCIVASQDGANPIPVDVVDTVQATDALEANCTRFGDPDKSPISIDDGVFQVEGTTTSVAFKGVLAETQWFFWVYGLNGATGPTNNCRRLGDGRTYKGSGHRR